jgi:hypothetical protein
VQRKHLSSALLFFCAEARRGTQMVGSNRSSETAGDFVARILEKWLPQILVGDTVAVPDDDEEMNWRLFFAHSQDMQGFAADIFTGGKNERSIGGWAGLRDRWSCTETT